MKNKFTVTITDVYGSSHYTMDQILKKFALVIAIVLVTLLVAGLISFWSLKSELSIILGKKDAVLRNIKNIEEANTELVKQKSSLSGKVLNEQKKLFQIEDKIRDIEGIIGTPKYDTWDSKTKINKIVINNLQKYLLVKQIPTGYPIKYTRITASYGWRKHPINKTKEFHQGIDLKQTTGHPVKATANGIVTYSSFQGKKGYGNLVKISHNFSFTTSYGHLKSLKVKYGTFVKKGDLIGYVGSTGLSTGPHLHYEIKFLGKTVDPIDFIKNNLTKIFKNNRSIPWQKMINSLTNQKN